MMEDTVILLSSTISGPLTAYSSIQKSVQHKTCITLYIYALLRALKFGPHKSYFLFQGPYNLML